MSALGQAGGEGQAQGQAQGEGQSSGPDLGALTATLGQLQQGQDEIRGWFEQQRQQETPDESQQDVPDLSFLDEGLNLDPSVNQEDVNRRLNDVISGMVDQRAQALIAPIQQQQQEQQRDQMARDLVGEFPELAQPEVAQAVAGKGGLAEQLAESLGVPEKAGDPRLWRVAYMMSKAADAANGPGSADPGGANLESGVGAGPGQQRQADLVKSIMESGGAGSSVLNF